MVRCPSVRPVSSWSREPWLKCTLGQDYYLAFWQEKCTRAIEKHKCPLIASYKNLSFSDLSDFERNAEYIAAQYNITQQQPRRPLGHLQGAWPHVTEASLSEDFQGCKLRVTDNNIIIMTDAKENVSLFEHLLETGIWKHVFHGTVNLT